MLLLIPDCGSARGVAVGVGATIVVVMLEVGCQMTFRIKRCWCTSRYSIFLNLAFALSSQRLGRHSVQLRRVPVPQALQQDVLYATSVMEKLELQIEGCGRALSVSFLSLLGASCCRRPAHLGWGPPNCILLPCFTMLLYSAEVVIPQDRCSLSHVLVPV